MKAKLFKFLPIELKRTSPNSNEFQLKKPVEISAKDYLGKSKFKLPNFIHQLLSKKIIIKNIIWRKPKQTTIETEINLESLFKKAEKYVELNEAKLIVSTDINIINKVS